MAMLAHQRFSSLCSAAAAWNRNRQAQSGTITTTYPRANPPKPQMMLNIETQNKL